MTFKSGDHRDTFELHVGIHFEVSGCLEMLDGGGKEGVGHLVVHEDHMVEKLENVF